MALLYTPDIHLVFTVGSDFKLLPHFLRHYRSIGVYSILPIIHDRHNVSEAVRSILDLYHVSIAQVWSEEFSETLKHRYERSVVIVRCKPSDWVIYADLDEFQQYPLEIETHIDVCERRGIHYLEGRMLDRISSTGELTPIDFKTSLEDQYPLGGYITRGIMGAWDKKIVAARASVDIGGGHHVSLDQRGRPSKYCPDLSPESKGIIVHHFKWDATVLNRMRRHINYKDCSLRCWVKEMRLFLKYIEKNGKIDINDSRLSISSQPLNIGV